MKKKIIFMFAVAAFAGALTFNSVTNSNKTALSAVNLANIEALAQNEGDNCGSNGGSDCPNGCTSEYDPAGCFCYTHHWNIKPYCWN